jgi:methylmalonyl-CoA/ethylmalonyl-CoA epimerase
VFLGIDHVVIAVKDLDAAVGRYESIYGTSVSDRSEVPAAGMAMAFFRFGSSFIELVSATSDQGPIAKRLAEQGEGIHLVAMRVDNVEQTLADLRAKGIRLVGDPGPGNPVKGQVFIHPSVTGGVLTQILQR